MGQCNFLHLWHQKLYRAFRFGTLWPISCSYPRHSQLTRHSLMLANGRIRQSLTALVTWSQYWPMGIAIACVWVCVRQRFCPHTFQLESSNLDKKVRTLIDKIKWPGSLLFGGDWHWPSRSNLTSFQNPVYLHRFFVLKCLWDMNENGSLFNSSPSQMTPNIYWFLYTHRYGRATDLEAVYFICSETIAGFRFKSPLYHSMCRGDLKVMSQTRVQSSVDSAIGTGFYTNPTCRNVLYQQSTIAETTVKQCPLALIGGSEESWRIHVVIDDIYSTYTAGEYAFSLMIFCQSDYQLCADMYINNCTINKL